MPSRQINDFLQKRKQKKIELVARPEVFQQRTVFSTKTESTTVTRSTPTTPQPSFPMELQDWLYHTTFGQLPWPRTTFQTPLWLRVLIQAGLNSPTLATFTKIYPSAPKLLRGIRLLPNIIQTQQLVTAGMVTKTLFPFVFFNATVGCK